MKIRITFQRERRNKRIYSYVVKVNDIEIARTTDRKSDALAAASQAQVVLDALDIPSVIEEDEQR